MNLISITYKLKSKKIVKVKTILKVTNMRIEKGEKLRWRYHGAN